MQIHIHIHDHRNGHIEEKLDEAIKLLINLLKQNKMNHEELLTEVSAIATQLSKGIAEVIAALAKVPNVPQSVVDKLTEVKASVQQLDDLNPDAPAPEPEV